MENAKEERSEKILLRVERADISTFPPEQIEIATACMRSYVAKFGREGAPLDPDSKIVAQFLACAAPEDGGIVRLQVVMQELYCERRPCGYSWAWFVSVALQRIHGIAPPAQKAFRERRKRARHGAIAGFAGAGELAALAGAKRLR